MGYKILQVEPTSVVDDEQLGSKDKFWFEHEKQRWLFKEARTISTPAGAIFTGEDWAEKAAAEIAKLINIRAATVELAEYQSKPGSASLNFTAPSEHLEHGNEILTGRVLGYDQYKKHRQSDHTLENIVSAVQSMFPKTKDNQYVLEQLAGYIVLDALICNTDRHHENWGLFWRAVRIDEPIEDWDPPQRLLVYNVAPTFDHASSLGRELLDEKRAKFLQENRVENYVKKGRGGIYWRSTDTHGENPLQLVVSATKLYPTYFQPTLEAVAKVPITDFQSVIDDIPESRISTIGKEFAKVMLSFTHRTLTGLTK